MFNDLDEQELRDLYWQIWMLGREWQGHPTHPQAAEQYRGFDRCNSQSILLFNPYLPYLRSLETKIQQLAAPEAKRIVRHLVRGVIEDVPATAATVDTIKDLTIEGDLVVGGKIRGPGY